ncbi:MAG: hypothetical protein GSR84_06110 [Desulfurococcales archaeon]|nr:hypothetical protein [Desulfurococcales archaeon]
MEAYGRPIAVIDEHRYGLVYLAFINIFILLLLSPLIVSVVGLYHESRDPDVCCTLEGSRIVCRGPGGAYRNDLGILVLIPVALFVYISGVRSAREYPVIEVYSEYMLLRFPLGKAHRIPKAPAEIVVSGAYRGVARATINPFGISFSIAVRDVEKLREALTSVWGVEPKIRITE